jgi:hypothetical protein
MIPRDFPLALSATSNRYSYGWLITLKVRMTPNG